MSFPKIPSEPDSYREAESSDINPNLIWAATPLCRETIFEKRCRRSSTPNLQLSTSTAADYPIFGSLADIGPSVLDVCFTPNSGRGAGPFKESAMCQ